MYLENAKQDTSTIIEPSIDQSNVASLPAALVPRQSKTAITPEAHLAAFLRWRLAGSMALERTLADASLVDVLDHVLDKGIIIDAWVRVSLMGLDLVTIEARIMVASIQTYLVHSPAVAQVAPVSQAVAMVRPRVPATVSSSPADQILLPRPAPRKGRFPPH